MYITSKNACEHFGIHANTLRKWADDGKISHIRSPSGQRLYDVSSVGKKINTRTKICYARVSSASQKEDLERQVLFLKQKYPEFSEIAESLTVPTMTINDIQPMYTDPTGSLFKEHRETELTNITSERPISPDKKYRTENYEFTDLRLTGTVIQEKQLLHV